MLYLPSAYPPERFINQLRTEHELATDFWGTRSGNAHPARMLDLLATAQQASPVPSLANAPAPNPVGLAVVKQMSEVNTRLFNNPIGPMSFNEFCDFTHEHAIAPERLREIFEKGGNHGWRLRNVVTIKSPVSYIHRRGAVIKVKLDPAAIDVLGKQLNRVGDNGCFKKIGNLSLIHDHSLHGRQERRAGGVVKIAGLGQILSMRSMEYFYSKKAGFGNRATGDSRVATQSTQVKPKHLGSTMFLRHVFVRLGSWLAAFGIGFDLLPHRIYADSIVKTISENPMSRLDILLAGLLELVDTLPAEEAAGQVGLTLYGVAALLDGIDIAEQ